jgi:hypothetical protein
MKRMTTCLKMTLAGYSNSDCFGDLLRTLHAEGTVYMGFSEKDCEKKVASAMVMYSASYKDRIEKRGQHTR